MLSDRQSEHRRRYDFYWNHTLQIFPKSQRLHWLASREFCWAACNLPQKWRALWPWWTDLFFPWLYAKDRPGPECSLQGHLRPVVLALDKWWCRRFQNKFFLEEDEHNWFFCSLFFAPHTHRYFAWGRDDKVLPMQLSCWNDPFAFFSQHWSYHQIQVGRHQQIHHDWGGQKLLRHPSEFWPRRSQDFFCGLAW